MRRFIDVNRAGLRGDRLRGSLRVVHRAARGVLGRALGVRGRRASPALRARRRRSGADAGRALVRGRAAQLRENLLRHRDERTALVFAQRMRRASAADLRRAAREVGARRGRRCASSASAAGDRVAGFCRTCRRRSSRCSRRRARRALVVVLAGLRRRRRRSTASGRSRRRCCSRPTATATAARASTRCAQRPQRSRAAARARARGRRAVPRRRAASSRIARARVAVTTISAAARPRELEFEQLPFDHPLYIMYSSGTTGVPKCIVHGAGGTLLQHLKEHVLHTDLKPRRPHLLLHDLRLDDVELAGVRPRGRARRSCSTTARRCIRTASVLVASSPSASGITRLRHQRELSRARSRRPASSRAQAHDLRALRAILSTGSPLAPESFDYVYRDVKPRRAARRRSPAAPTSSRASRSAIRCCRCIAASCSAAASA